MLNVYTFKLKQKGGAAESYRAKCKEWYDSSCPWRNANRSCSPQMWMVARHKVHLYILLYVCPWENVLSVKVGDSMIIRDSMTLGGEGTSNVLSKIINTVTFRIALKAVGNNSKV